MKIAYNSNQTLMIQEVENAPDFEFIELTSEIESSLNSMVKPLIVNGLIVETATEEEINQQNFIQFIIYKNRLIEAYCFLIKRAKASAMQKELNPDYQQCLEIAYNLKHEIASGSKTNAYVESLMQSEAENDFEQPLSLEYYYGMVETMFQNGAVVFDSFVAMVERGRSAGLTAIERNDLQKLIAIVELMESVPEELTMLDAQNLTAQLITLAQRTE